MLFAAGCGNSTPNQVSGQVGASSAPLVPVTKESSVRLAHLWQGAPNVDVFVNGERRVQDLSFGKLSSYVKLPEGESQIEVRPAGSSNVVASGRLRFQPDSFQTVGVLGPRSAVVAQTDAAPTGSLVLVEDNVTPTANKTRVRLVHAAPDLPSITVSASGITSKDDEDPGTSFEFPITTSPLAFGQSAVVNSLDVLDFRGVRAINLTQSGSATSFTSFTGPSAAPSGPLLTAYSEWTPADGVNATAFIYGTGNSGAGTLSMLVVVDGGDAAGLSITGNATYLAD